MLDKSFYKQFFFGNLIIQIHAHSMSKQFLHEEIYCHSISTRIDPNPF